MFLQVSGAAARSSVIAIAQYGFRISFRRAAALVRVHESRRCSRRCVWSYLLRRLGRLSHRKHVSIQRSLTFSTRRFGREIRCRLVLKHSASAIQTCLDCRGAGSQCMRRRFGAKVPRWSATERPPGRSSGGVRWHAAAHNAILSATKRPMESYVDPEPPDLKIDREPFLPALQCDALSASESGHGLIQRNT